MLKCTTLWIYSIYFSFFKSWNQINSLPVFLLRELTRRSSTPLSGVGYMMARHHCTIFTINSFDMPFTDKSWFITFLNVLLGLLYLCRAKDYLLTLPHWWLHANLSAYTFVTNLIFSCMTIHQCQHPHLCYPNSMLLWTDICECLNAAFWTQACFWCNSLEAVVSIYFIMTLFLSKMEKMGVKRKKSEIYK